MTLSLSIDFTGSNGTTSHPATVGGRRSHSKWEGLFVRNLKIWHETIENGYGHWNVVIRRFI